MDSHDPVVEYNAAVVVAPAQLYCCRDRVSGIGIRFDLVQNNVSNRLSDADTVDTYAP
jgi:hypothetical protein